MFSLCFLVSGASSATERHHHVTHTSNMIVREISITLAVILIAGVSESVVAVVSSVNR